MWKRKIRRSKEHRQHCVEARTRTRRREERAPARSQHHRYADKNEWIAARKEWDGVFSDLQSGMIEIKSKELSQLVSLGGWLRGTEALCALVLENYSPERAELIRQPLLLDPWRSNFSE